MVYSYLITHNKFSGTIETLLTLIQKREVDIYEIKLATIIGDFLSYIREKKDISLDVISNFLYMASILLEIKSKSIIPTGKNLEDEEVELDRELKDILKRREDDYKIYKRASLYLEKLYEKENYYFVREAPIEEGFLNLLPNFLKDVTPEDLAKVGFKTSW